jgi:hypothetical protein
MGPEKGNAAPPIIALANRSGGAAGEAGNPIWNLFAHLGA